MGTRATVAIITVVTVVWVVNFAADLLIKDYDGAPVNTVFAAVIGAAFALSAGRKPPSGTGSNRGGSVE